MSTDNLPTSSTAAPGSGMLVPSESLQPANLEPIDMSLQGLLTHRDSFEYLQRVAKLWAGSSFVPERYRNIPDCAMALHLSLKLGVDPIFFMQKAYPVHGKMGLEGQLVMSIAKNKGPWVDGIRFEYKGSGNERICTAYGVRADGERDEFSMTIAEVKVWGWWDKKDSSWPKMPDQMLAYRTAVFLVRRICPWILMGMETTDEIRDYTTATVTETVSGKLTERVAQVQVLGTDTTAQEHRRRFNEPNL